MGDEADERGDGDVVAEGDQIGFTAEHRALGPEQPATLADGDADPPRVRDGIAGDL
jgi:hypothetical protein